MAARRLHPLPFDPTPPSLGDVTAAARRCGLVAALDRLQQLAARPGLELTAGGDLVAPPDGLVDGAARQRLLVAVAVECGAATLVTDRHGADRLVADDRWPDEDVVVRADAALDALFDLGVLCPSSRRRDSVLGLRDAVLDSDCIPWLITLLPDGRTRTIDNLVERAIDLFRGLVGGDLLSAARLEQIVGDGLRRLVATLVWAGVVEPAGPGRLRLTALGRYVVPERLAEAGMRRREPCPPGEPVPAERLLGDLLMCPDGDGRTALVESWRDDLPRDERARLLCDALMAGDRNSVELVVGFDALEVLGVEVAAPFVRELLDSPAAANAAAFLVCHDLADPDQFEGFSELGPLVDSLAMLTTEPAGFGTWMSEFLSLLDDPAGFLREVAHLRSEGATMLLTAAARHVDDPRFAGMVLGAERLHHGLVRDGSMAVPAALVAGAN